jgi:transposase-like protein
MNDMVDAQKLIQRLQQKRDALIRRLLAAGYGPTKIGAQLGVSRQRAQQLIKRLNGIT